MKSTFPISTRAFIPSTEQTIDRYEPQQSQRVTIVSGQTATVHFSNILKRGDLEVTKTSEDGLVEGATFHLYGTSLSGLEVDEYAVADSTGVARLRTYCSAPAMCWKRWTSRPLCRPRSAERGNRVE